MDGALVPARIQPLLGTTSFGRRCYYYPETDSTNTIATALAREGEAEGTVVVSDYQRRGRGRQGHVWHSAPRTDLLFSILLRPTGKSSSVLPVTLALSTSVAIALARATGVDVGVKWPNDVVTRGGKLAGLLAEASHRGGEAAYVVLGVGVNVNADPATLPGAVGGRAVSVRSLTGNVSDRALLLADLLGFMEAWYQRFQRDGFGALRPGYEERMIAVGARIRFQRAGEAHVATVTGVADDGGLRVEVAGSEQLLYGEPIEVIE